MLELGTELGWRKFTATTRQWSLYGTTPGRDTIHTVFAMMDASLNSKVTIEIVNNVLKSLKVALPTFALVKA